MNTGEYSKNRPSEIVFDRSKYCIKQNVFKIKTNSILRIF